MFQAEASLDKRLSEDKLRNMAAKESRIVGLKELRENTEKYIAEVKRGRSFTVVRRSKPVFRVSPIDEWGDGGMWEAVADFREIEPSGVATRDVLKTLSRIRG